MPFFLIVISFKYPIFQFCILYIAATKALDGGGPKSKAAQRATAKFTVINIANGHENEFSTFFVGALRVDFKLQRKLSVPMEYDPKFGWATTLF